MEKDFCMADDETWPAPTHVFELEQSRFFCVCVVVVVLGPCDSPDLEKKRSCVSAHMGSHTKWMALLIIRFRGCNDALCWLTCCSCCLMGPETLRCACIICCWICKRWYAWLKRIKSTTLVKGEPQQDRTQRVTFNRLINLVILTILALNFWMNMLLFLPVVSSKHQKLHSKLTLRHWRKSTWCTRMKKGTVTHHLQLLKLVQESHLLRVYWWG